MQQLLTLDDRLSGVVSVQCIVYFKLYPKDKKILKCLVSWPVNINSLSMNLGSAGCVSLVSLTRSSCSAHRLMLARLLDLIHSIFVWSAMWESLIANFGVKSKVDSIPR